MHAPSVISLNAVAAARAVDDWQMTVGGLVERGASQDRWAMNHPLLDEVMDVDREADGMHAMRAEAIRAG